MMVRSTHDSDANLDRLIEESAAAHEPVHLTNRQGQKAVLICEEEWRSIEQTLYLQSVPGLAKSITDARGEPMNDAIDRRDVQW